MNTLITPNSVSSDLLPTVVNLEEARERCHDFDAVITAGPSLYEVRDFRHPAHQVVEFDDVTSSHFGFQPPTLDDVERLVAWGKGRTNLLVHCHAGISRSTATAWGIAIANGFDPQEAFHLLKTNHPVESRLTWDNGRQRVVLHDPRPFEPNRLILTHLETLFDLRPRSLRRMLERERNTKNQRSAE